MLIKLHYCYICKKVILAQGGAKVIEIREEGGETGSCEYARSQEDMYIHLNCLKTTPPILCQALNDENSLVRNNLLEFIDE